MDVDGTKLTSPGETPEATPAQASTVDAAQAAKEQEKAGALAEPRDAAAGEAPRGGAMSMTDYEEAMTPRAQRARARGLAAPYIAGGRDPNPEQGRREERHYMRLLIAMVLAIVLGGFALSILYVLVTGGR